jgi:hypothetical protein
VLEDISQRFVNGAQAFWRIKKKEKIDELLKDEAPPVVQGEGLTMLTGFC